MRFFTVGQNWRRTHPIRRLGCLRVPRLQHTQKIPSWTLFVPHFNYKPIMKLLFPSGLMHPLLLVLVPASDRRCGLVWLQNTQFGQSEKLLSQRSHLP